MEAQPQTRTEERLTELPKTKWSLEWVRQGNQAFPIVTFDGEPVGFLRDVALGVDEETSIPTLTIKVLAPGLTVVQKDLIVGV